MNNTPQLDSGSVHGFIGSCGFIVLAHITSFIESLYLAVTLQNASYTVAIIVGLDTLTGNPIKKFFKNLWSKTNDNK